MKYILRLSLISLCLLMACNKNSSSICQVEMDPIFESLTKSIDTDATYDEHTGYYLVPNQDVYELSFVQKTYEQITGSKDQLQPTHKAIKLMPQDEATAHRLLSDTTMWVSCIPFGWRPVAQKPDPVYEASSRNLSCEENRSTDVIFDEGIPPVILPVYARWPVDRSIPSDISYEYLYDIYTPSSNTEVDSLLCLALAPTTVPRVERPDSGNPPQWHLQIKTFDTTLNSFQVVKQVHVTYKNYSTYYTQTLCTDSFGMVAVPFDAPMSTVVLLDLYTDDFKVTSDNNSNYVSQLVYPLYALAEMPYESHLGIPTTPVELPYIFKLQVFRAAHYYYNGHNDLLDNIAKLELDTPLRIAAYTDTLITHDGVDGWGWFMGGSNPPYIEIANYAQVSGKIFGTTLHELGHASHYTELGLILFGVAHDRIKESFASFMGWYNVKEYYSSVLADDAAVNNACTQGRQYWAGDNTNNYTPIYIDLVDNFNQSTVDSSLVNDAITGVSVEDVLSFSIGPVVWAHTRYLMQQQVGVLYTSTDFNNFISLYPTF